MLEERALIETIKPASGFITAALGPKIEKVRKWANEKDLKGKLDSNALAATMERYLVKLSHRVSEITSITFPQLKLNIFEAYEPLYMTQNAHFDSDPQRISTDDIIVPRQRSLIIIDSAGMGKSTFSKYIVARLLHKSDKIPILFDLRKTNPESNVIENIASELDLPGEQFDRELFYKLLELGKFFVILDGFDEARIDHQEELANQINNLSVKGGQNTLLVTSRPQDVIPELLNATPLRFIPFTLEQATSLLDRYDRISNLEVGCRLAAEIGSVPAKFIESPLLVSLLYRTFGVNNSIADRISTFYDEIYHALYKGHDLINKNGYAREKKSKLDFEDFRKLLRSLCHYMMLKRKTAFNSWSEAVSFIDKASAIASVNPRSASDFLDDLFVAVPLMQRDGTELKFFHKTLLEYFAAEYIIFNKSSLSLLQRIFDSPLAPSYTKAFEFLEDINQSLFESVITKHFAQLAEKLPLSGGRQSLAISTCQFLNNFKVGLWPTEGSSDVFDDHPRPILSGDIHSAGGHQTTSWRNGTIGGVHYYLSIAFSGKHDRLHPLAWQAITNEVDAYPPEDDESFILDGIEKIISPGSWITPSAAIIKKLRTEKNLAIEYMFMSAIDDIFINENGKLRILDSNKIESVLMKIKSRDELNIEMDDYL
ncbi:NACHT domain-containing protein [Stutzerimonas nitrititolerans]|uniref:NACHT domain-containing protein n=1 Tax=Stutzerimonas nitrititolerans TaxID=2482751 RepID=UPI0028AD15AC|nr:NACHT domain-containing protein [Stutzerimonas nitrititolerans]